MKRNECIGHKIQLTHDLLTNRRHPGNFHFLHWVEFLGHSGDTCTRTTENSKRRVRSTGIYCAAKPHTRNPQPGAASGGYKTVHWLVPGMHSELYNADKGTWGWTDVIRQRENHVVIVPVF